MGKKQDYNFEIYKILVEENRHVHQRWNDNFRIFLIFNPILDEVVKSLTLVTPAKAGVQKCLKLLDSGSSPE